MSLIPLLDLRDLVYTRILTKRAASAFIFNDFTVHKVYIPSIDMRALSNASPNGRVYVLAGSPGDLIRESRTNRGLRELPVMIGFQKAGINVDNIAELDEYVKLVGELEDMVRTEIQGPTNDYSFSRLEYLKSEEGIPLSFVTARTSKMFEAYLSGFFDYVTDPS